MDEDLFRALRDAAKARGDHHGVSAELLLVHMQQSSVNPPGQRLQLRVFRFVQGESMPREYSNAAGYSPSAPHLLERIEADIDIAARKLYETP
jgi:hypothetical protein